MGAFEAGFEAEVAAGFAFPEALGEGLGEFAAGAEGDFAAGGGFDGGGEGFGEGGGVVFAADEGTCGAVALDDEPVAEQIGHHAGHDGLSGAVFAAADGLEEVGTVAGGDVEHRQLDAALGGGVAIAHLDVVPHVVDLDDLAAFEAGAGAGDHGQEVGGGEGAGAGGGKRPFAGLVAHEVGQAPAHRQEGADFVGAFLGEVAPGALGAPDVAPGTVAGDSRAGTELGDEGAEGGPGDALVFGDEVVPVFQEGGIGADAGGLARGFGQEGAPAAFAPPLAGAVVGGFAVEALGGEPSQAPGVFHGEAFGHQRALRRRGRQEGFTDLAQGTDALHFAQGQPRKHGADGVGGDKRVHG